MQRAKIAGSPFFLLTLSLILGIIIQHFFHSFWTAVVFMVAGVVLALLSCLLHPRYQYPLRWLFGAGICCLIAAVAAMLTSFSVNRSTLVYSSESAVYEGIVLDIPTERHNSLLSQVELTYPTSVQGKTIECRFQKTDLCRSLLPGDRLRFSGIIEPPYNTGNPNSQTLRQRVQNSGLSGCIYLPEERWEPVFKTQHSVLTFALRCRAQSVEFLRTLPLSSQTVSIISALTLGYRADVSEENVEAFRATGIAHILAVSGLHTGIVFSLILLLFRFLPRRKWCETVKYLSTILLLLAYSLFTGLSPSVLRASLMLSLYCAGKLFRRDAFSFNLLFASAFFILLSSPLTLFDVGFQLSFSAMFFILFFQNCTAKRHKSKKRIYAYIRDMLLVCLWAQVGTLPLCLYYFGSFPLYFLAVNLLALPLVSLIFYLSPLPVIFKLLSSSFLLAGACTALDILTDCLLVIVHFFQSLPYSQIHGLHIHWYSVCLIYLLVLCVSFWILQKKPKYLLMALSCVLLLLAIPLPSRFLKPESELWVWNNSSRTQVQWQKNRQLFAVTSDSLTCRMLPFGEERFVTLNSFDGDNYCSDTLYRADYLLLAGGEQYSLASLSRSFLFRFLILDATLTRRTRERLAKECREQQVTCYDVVENGALHIVF